MYSNARGKETDAPLSMKHYNDWNYICLKAFPSITADVMFLCWRQDCNNTTFSQLPTFYALQWSTRLRDNHSFIRSDLASNYTMIKPRVFIVNERQLNLTGKTTWTTARNILYERALIEERQQGWRWAYFTFGDGDLQLGCPLAEKLLKMNQTDGDELVIARQFRSLITTQQSLMIRNNTDQCFLLFDTFLLTASPAVGSVSGMQISPLFDGLLTQIVYHIDAMFNAFHRDALSFVLPYCARYDARSWWTSQAILIYRSLCLYGHAIQLNAVSIIRQKHRAYPRGGNSWAIDEDMNLVPSSLFPLKAYMKQSRVVSALVLRHYGGWSLELVSSECRDRYTVVDPSTCKKHTPTPVSSVDTIAEEIEHYLKLDINCDDVLQFWRSSGDAFPRLRSLARIVLAILATSALSECVFLTNGLIISAKRTMLSAENVGKIHIIHDNFDILKIV